MNPLYSTSLSDHFTCHSQLIKPDVLFMVIRSIPNFHTAVDVPYKRFIKYIHQPSNLHRSIISIPACKLS